MTFAKEDPGRVLIVDDEDINLTILRTLIRSRGYEVIEARNGEEALERVAEDSPDAVLLDVLMPGMDGFEVCRRLKSDPVTASIPVLMVTALKKREERLEGIGAGANDFISKPIDEQEVALRLRNALRLKHLFDMVKENFERQQCLSKELEAKNEELAEFAHIVSHDLKSPLSSLTSILGIVRDMNWVSGDGSELIEAGIKACFEMSDFINCVLRLSLAGKVIGECGPVNMQDLITHLFDTIKPQDVRAALVFTNEPPVVTGDPVRLRQVLLNLISNAFSYRDLEKEELIITINHEERPDDFLFSVGDNGNGIPPDLISQIFDIGYSRKKKEGRTGTGFGLAITKKVVEAHGGKIWAESEGPGRGTTFFFTVSKKI
jgi:signal transduction histidine kinase